MLGIILLSYLLLEMMYHYILFQVFLKLFLFLYFVGIYVTQEATIFHYSSKRKSFT